MARTPYYSHPRPIMLHHATRTWGRSWRGRLLLSSQLEPPTCSSIPIHENTRAYLSLTQQAPRPLSIGCKGQRVGNEGCAEIHGGYRQMVDECKGFCRTKYMWIFPSRPQSAYGWLFQTALQKYVRTAVFILKPFRRTICTFWFCGSFEQLLYLATAAV